MTWPMLDPRAAAVITGVCEPVLRIALGNHQRELELDARKRERGVVNSIMCRTQNVNACERCGFVSSRTMSDEERRANVLTYGRFTEPTDYKMLAHLALEHKAVV